MLQVLVLLSLPTPPTAGTETALKNRQWSLDPLVCPSGRRVGVHEQTCASDKVNCEQTDVQLLGTRHLLVMTNLVCSIIAGNIKPGLSTASALHPVQSEISYRDMCLQYHCFRIYAWLHSLFCL